MEITKLHNVRLDVDLYILLQKLSNDEETQAVWAGPDQEIIF